MGELFVHKDIIDKKEVIHLHHAQLEHIQMFKVFHPY